MSLNLLCLIIFPSLQTQTQAVNKFGQQTGLSVRIYKLTLAHQQSTEIAAGASCFPVNDFFFF